MKAKCPGCGKILTVDDEKLKKEFGSKKSHFEKWIIATAVVFLTALVIGIIIGRYHYEHITLRKINVENNNIQPASEYFAPEPIMDIFLGEPENNLLKRFQLEDCTGQERVFIRPILPLPGEFSTENVFTYFFNNKVCAIEIFYPASTKAVSSNLYDSLQTTLRLKYRDYLIYDYDSEKIIDIVKNFYWKDNGDAIEDCVLLGEAYKKIEVLKTTINNNKCFVVLMQFKTNGVMLQYISLDVLGVKI